MRERPRPGGCRGGPGAAAAGGGGGAGWAPTRGRQVRLATERFARSNESELRISSSVVRARLRIAAFLRSQASKRCSGVAVPSPTARTSEVSAAWAAYRSSRMEARAMDCQRSDRGSSMIRSISWLMCSRSPRS